MFFTAQILKNTLFSLAVQLESQWLSGMQMMHVHKAQGKSLWLETREYNVITAVFWDVSLKFPGCLGMRMEWISLDVLVVSQETYNKDNQSATCNLKGFKTTQAVWYIIGLYYTSLDALPTGSCLFLTYTSKLGNVPSLGHIGCIFFVSVALTVQPKFSKSQSWKSLMFAALVITNYSKCNFF